MRAFTAKDSFYIKDRGKVFFFNKEQLPNDLYDPSFLRGEIVEIDSVQYKVVGVETFAIARSKEHPYSLDFGLLVDDAS